MGPEPRYRDHGPKDDWYAEPMHNQQVELKEGQDQDMQRLQYN